MTIVNVVTPQVWNGSAWVATVAQTRVSRPTPEVYVGQPPTYTPTWALEWVDCDVHRQYPTGSTRVVEGFLNGTTEVLHGDGVTDDTAMMNLALFRAKNWAATHANFTLRLRYTYLCDGELGFSDSDPLTWMRITGPGKTTRTYVKPNGDRGFIGSDRDQAQWRFTRCNRLQLHSFTINGWRPVNQDGGRNNAYEAQHGVWLLGCQDVELRNLTITNVMGDHVAIAYSASPRINPADIRIYNNTFKNSGRLICSPLAQRVDMYGCWGERNASSIFDIETSGTALIHDVVIRNNRFHNCNGSFLHIPSYGWTEKYCTATNGSKVLTSAGTAPSSRFGLGEVGRVVENGHASDKQPSGNGIPAGAKIVSFESDTHVTMDVAASGVTTATGYRRIYINQGSNVDNITIADNVRTSSTGRSETAVSIYAGGGTLLDGTHTLKDLVVTDNMWDREPGVNTIWGISGCDRAKFQRNHGPWRSGVSGAEAIEMTQVTNYFGTQLTNSQVRNQNPDVFASPV